MKTIRDTAGSRTPRRGKNIQKKPRHSFRAVSACVVTTWRGEIQFIIYTMKKIAASGGVEPPLTEKKGVKQPPTQPVLAILHGVSRRMQETL